MSIRQRESKPLRRIVTSHDPSGQAIFSDTVSDQVSFSVFPVAQQAHDIGLCSGL
jgi:hypothetical protein